jgi:hypothetical protein
VPTSSPGGVQPHVGLAAGKPTVAASLDSAAMPDGVVWRFDVDHILRCLAVALQDKVILDIGQARPHEGALSTLHVSSIWLEPPALDKLAPELDVPPEALRAAAKAPRSSGEKVQNPLNDIAVRRVPDTWAMYSFFRNAVMGFDLPPEVAVVALVYIERLDALCGVRLTPDNWQRLAMTCLMLASKVWDDESYENQDFAAACPLYSVDEINAFERTFLTLIDYKVIVTGRQYAEAYFRLRVTGARDQARARAGQESVLPPLERSVGEALQESSLAKQAEWREKYHAHLEDVWAMHRKALRDRTVPENHPELADPDPLSWTM